MQTYVGAQYSRTILDLDIHKYWYTDKVILVLNWLSNTP
jgi:hypothetical protein